jgi:hypothetical protein
MSHKYNLRKKNRQNQAPRIVSQKEENLRKRKRPVEEGSRKKQKLELRCRLCQGEGISKILDGEYCIGNCEICKKSKNSFCYDCIGSEEFDRKFDSCDECYIVVCKKHLIYEEKGIYCAPCLKRCISK